MTKLDSYLFFDGQCAEAMRFYERVLNGKLRMVSAKDSPPDQVPPGAENKTMHAQLDADGAVIMASDWMDSHPYPGMHGFRVCLSVKTAADAKKLFDKLADGGKADMPFQKTFYSDGFGMLTDRFGTPWMVMAEENSSGSQGTST